MRRAPARRRAAMSASYASRMSDSGIATMTTTMSAADDRADARAARHELGDARVALFLLRPREHREEDLGDAEEELIREEREELAGAVDRDPLVARPSRVGASYPLGVSGSGICAPKREVAAEHEDVGLHERR